jgi:hypothetical protein
MVESLRPSDCECVGVTMRDERMHTSDRGVCEWCACDERCAVCVYSELMQNISLLKPLRRKLIMKENFILNGF